MARLVENTGNLLAKHADTGRLSPRGKVVTLVFVAIGLATFFLPIIKFEPAVHGQQYGSILDITLLIQAALDPDLPPYAILILSPFGLVYVTLLVALAAILLLPFRKALRWISLVGLFFLYPFRGLFGAIRLAAFLESSRHSVGFITIWAVLGIVMLAVAAVAWTDATV